MAHDGDGKGPGYVYLWCGACGLFAVMFTAAWLAGAIPWWGAAIGDGVALGIVVNRMRTAKWA